MCCAAGPTEFHSVNGGARADEAFLELLRAQTGPSMAGPEIPKGKAHPKYGQLAKLQLQESDVAKVRSASSMLAAARPARVCAITLACDYVITLYLLLPRLWPCCTFVPLLQP